MFYLSNFTVRHYLQSHGSIAVICALVGAHSTQHDSRLPVTRSLLASAASAPHAATSAEQVREQESTIAHLPAAGGRCRRP